jgi:rhodanese-related sulfurtransferase
MPRISVDDTKQLLAQGQAVIIDVRGTDAYNTTHIKDALDFPLARMESGDFKGLPKDKRIIAYCT